MAALASHVARLALARAAGGKCGTSGGTPPGLIAGSVAASSGTTLRWRWRSDAWPSPGRRRAAARASCVGWGNLSRCAGAYHHNVSPGQRLRSACASRRAPTHGRGSRAVARASSQRRPAALDQQPGLPILECPPETVAAGRYQWLSSLECPPESLLTGWRGSRRRRTTAAQPLSLTQPTWLVGGDEGSCLAGGSGGGSRLTGGSRRSHLDDERGCAPVVSMSPRRMPLPPDQEALASCA